MVYVGTNVCVVAAVIVLVEDVGVKVCVNVCVVAAVMVLVVKEESFVVQLDNAMRIIAKTNNKI